MQGQHTGYALRLLLALLKAVLMFIPALPVLCLLHKTFASMNLALLPINTILTWRSDLARLLSEKDILENGLADCVTYLHVLRKRHARNERHLIANPSLPRKKRKKMRHSNRELEREIQNREQDERAFLENLQACNANIYVAATFSCSSTNLASTVPEYNLGSTDYSFATASEPTEASWNGWTNDASISPFQKQSNNSFFVDEVAPDDYTGSMNISFTTDREIERPHPLLPCTEDDDAALPVPPNTARSPYPYLSLSPEATVFEPSSAHTACTDILLGQRLDRLSISPSLTTHRPEELPRRRTTSAGCDQVSRRLSLQTGLFAGDDFQKWCNTTPQHSPSKDTRIGVLRRSRTASL